MVPQLVEQWRIKSAQGISIGFIAIWFLGDLLNLVGSIWAHLLLQVVFLAVWFCFADSMMVISYLYYSKLYKGDEGYDQQEVDEQEPLVEERRRSSAATSSKKFKGVSFFKRYVFPVVCVVLAGILGYLVSGGSKEPEDPNAPIETGPQIIGYLSAFLYLGARIPQIVQNHRRKSVHGLSLLFFVFSTLGNLSYAGQILFYRSDWHYVVLNLSWLLGSLGTLFEDSFIFFQFYLYKDYKKHVESV